jgi:hypothetical protein
MKTWRCAICKVEGEAADERTAERAMVHHWRIEHLTVEGRRDADHVSDAG